MKKKLLISFSGGRTSAYMTWWLLTKWNDRHNWEIIVVFANTGKEKPETLLFVHRFARTFRIDVVWVEADINPIYGEGIRHNVVDYFQASRKGEPFEAVIAKYGIPNQEAPFCSDYLKRYPILSYAKSIGWDEYKTAIGIRSDETGRLNWDKAKKRNLIYPFATIVKVVKSDVNKFWSEQDFDLGIKSYEGNCDFCWKKSMRKLLTITKEKPELTDWWNEMFLKYGYTLSPKRKENKNIKLPVNFFRSNITIDELKDESKLPFVTAKDESFDIDKFKQIPLWDDYLDPNDGCVESCEAF